MIVIGNVDGLLISLIGTENVTLVMMNTLFPYR